MPTPRRRLLTLTLAATLSSTVLGAHVMSERDAPLPDLAVPSTNCSAVTKCSLDGTASYVFRALTYNTGSGVFTGSLTTNQCPSDPRAYSFGGVMAQGPINNAECVTQTFPAVTVLPAAANLRGAVGWSVQGENVYGPFDAGFMYGMLCDNGQCPPGSDVEFCGFDIERQCGSDGFRSEMLLSDCGGHATPWHYHTALACAYDPTAAGHSSLAAVILDGRGLYGKYESTGVLPTDLDACGGHFGYTPESTIGSNVYPASTTQVYHYHVQDQAPFTIGCLGPVTSLAQAKALYPSCSATGKNCTSIKDCSAGDLYNSCTSAGFASYVLDCPVFSNAPTGELFNQITPTLECPYCVGNITCEGTVCGCGVTAAPAQPTSIGLSSETVAAIAGGTVAGAVLLTGAAALYFYKTGGWKKNPHPALPTYGTK